MRRDAEHRHYWLLFETSENEHRAPLRLSGVEYDAIIISFVGLTLLSYPWSPL